MLILVFFFKQNDFSEWIMDIFFTVHTSDTTDSDSESFHREKDGYQSMCDVIGDLLREVICWSISRLVRCFFDPFVRPTNRSLIIRWSIRLSAPQSVKLFLYSSQAFHNSDLHFRICRTRASPLHGAILIPLQFFLCLLLQFPGSPGPFMISSPSL